MANYLICDNFYDDKDVMHCRFSLKSDKLLKLVNNRLLKHIANNLQNILNNESFYIFYVTFQKINTFLPTKRTLLQDNPKNQMNSLRKWSVNCMKESCNGVKGKIGGGGGTCPLQSFFGWNTTQKLGLPSNLSRHAMSWIRIFVFPEFLKGCVLTPRNNQNIR